MMCDKFLSTSIVRVLRIIHILNLNRLAFCVELYQQNTNWIVRNLCEIVAKFKGISISYHIIQNMH